VDRLSPYHDPVIFKLLQRLFLARAALASRVVVCCAIEQRGENNYICAQAAELLADLTQGSAVCVVDANLDRPSLHTYFDVQNRRGLADAMLETGLILEFTQSIGPEATLIDVRRRAPDRTECT
jgi:hypothetical protein